jgi:hypothetical protein
MYAADQKTLDAIACSRLHLNHQPKTRATVALRDIGADHLESIERFAVIV